VVPMLMPGVPIEQFIKMDLDIKMNMDMDKFIS
jgi:hypothetical protein